MTTYRLKATYYPLPSSQSFNWIESKDKEELDLGDKLLMQTAEKALRELCGRISFKSIELIIKK